MLQPFAREFIEQAIYRLNESTRMIRASFSELSDEDMWKRPNPASNSIGNLILHLRGNMTQYAISSLSGIPDARERDAEFAAREGYGRDALLVLLEATVEQVKASIRNADEANLLRERTVQGFRFTGIGIIVHVVEHYSYHTGQIAFWTKILKNKDLGFYAGMDLNAKNEL